MSQPEFRHLALLYGDDEEFLAGTVPALRASIEAGVSALVAVRPAKASLLREALGADASRVDFVDIEAIGRNPARIIPVWSEFLEGAPEDGPLVGIGEPAWPGRSEAELDECCRHEALLNVAFAGGRAWTLLCPYDATALDDEVLASACGTHAAVIGGSGVVDAAVTRAGGVVGAAAAPGPASARAPLEGDLPEPPSGARALRFAREGLGEVRQLVSAEAAASHLTPERVTDLVAAASELAANSVSHGGGSGALHVWREPGALVVEVRDAGRIAEPLAGRRRPVLAQKGGRGLWIANQLCDLVQVRSGEEGTRVRLRMACG